MTLFTVAGAKNARRTYVTDREACSSLQLALLNASVRTITRTVKTNTINLLVNSSRRSGRSMQTYVNAFVTRRTVFTTSKDHNDAEGPDPLHPA
jgi:hypothetical protein